nr:nuclear transport factor 2 family protein [Hyphomonas sp. 34-62-18]
MTSTPDLISRYYAAFNAKDWKAMAGCVSENINHFVNEGDKARAPRLNSSSTASTRKLTPACRKPPARLTACPPAPSLM